MKRNFNVVIELHGNAYVARCPEFPDLLARGSSKSEVLETLKALIRKKLDDGSWNCSIHVRTKTSSTDICTRVSPDHQANEMVIIAAEPLELTFIHMRGRMSLDDLSKMSGEIGGDKTKIKVKEK